MIRRRQRDHPVGNTPRSHAPLTPAASFRRALSLARFGPEQLYLTQLLSRAEETAHVQVSP